MTRNSLPMITDEVPITADVVVIGAGITGICTSLFLAERGVDVCLLDRKAPWSEASGVNAGTLAVQAEFIETVPLTRLSVNLWEEFDEKRGIGVGFNRIGGLRVAVNGLDVIDLRKSSEERRDRWGLDMEWLDERMLRVDAPWLGHVVRAATYCREDAMCSPLVAGGALIRAAVSAGAKVVPDAEVKQIVLEGKHYRVETPRGALRAPVVVVTAGPWSSAMTRMLGSALPTYVDIDMLSVTEPCNPVMDRMITHAGGQLSLKQFSNGSVVIGGAWQGNGRFAAMEKHLDQTRLLQNLAFAASIIPALSDLHILRSWSGYEGVAADAMPVIGRLPLTPNAYVAAITRAGYTHGPGMALLLSELILDQRTSLPIEQFAPGRLAEKPAGSPQSQRVGLP